MASTRLCAMAFAVAVAMPLAAITVTLSPYPAGPQPVGTSITWTATVSDTSGDVDYRFAVQETGYPKRIVRDFAKTETFTWTHSSFEGNFTIEVVARDKSTREVAMASEEFTLTSRLLGGQATVSPTRNPLVGLFSSPACLVPNSMRIRFHAAGSTESQTTNLIPCRAKPEADPDLTSMNVYVAGMYPSTTYQMNWEVLQPDGTTLRTGPERSFTTGAIPASVPIPRFTVRILPPVVRANQSLLLENYLTRDTPVAVTATDLLGGILWYYDTPGASVDRTTKQGTLMCRRGGGDGTPGTLAEIDLAGNVLAETNVRRVSEQLVAQGYRRILYFSHEVRRIWNPGRPNDEYIVVIGGTDMVSTEYQGGTPQKPVDILGDEIIVLDRNLQLSWAWDPFSHMDASRRAVLGEICTPSTQCKPLAAGFTRANDWLHTNTVQYTPWDGNLIASLRSQDWVIKINYADGTGDGRLIWRMGQDGDFTITTKGAESTADIAFPWFSHQHDSEFEFRGTLIGSRRIMTVYDNGNTRHDLFNSRAHSRCQMYTVDEANRTVNLNINADTGVYSEALGSAQLLSNGNLNCTGGASTPSTTTENDPAGNIVYRIEWPNSTYRTLRMRDMYSPATP